MKVLFVTFALPGDQGLIRTGPGTYIESVSSAIRRAGGEADVLWFSDEPSSTVIAPTLASGAIVHRTTLTWTRWISKWLPGLSEGWQLARAVAALDHEHRYDVIEGPNWSGICWALALRFPDRFWLRFHTSVAEAQGHVTPEPGWRASFRRTLDQFTSHRARHRITHSQIHADHLRQEYHLAPDVAIAIVPHGVASVGPRRKTDSSRRSILAFGGTTPRKGNDVVVRAMTRLAPTLDDVVLRIVGDAPEGGAWLDRLLAGQPAGMHDRITFEGVLSDSALDELWNEATVAVVASRYESFGLVAVEALMRGVPLISSTGGALPEVVGDGALLFDLEDDASLAGALEQLLADPESARRLAARGRARFDECFSLEQMGQRLLTVYGGPLAADRRPRSATEVRPG